MADIEIERTHGRSKAEARAAAEDVAARLNSMVGLTYEWEGDVLLLAHDGAKGRIEVGDDAVHLQVDLGRRFKPLKGMIRTAVTQYLDQELQAP